MKKIIIIILSCLWLSAVAAQSSTTTEPNLNAEAAEPQTASYLVRFAPLRIYIDTSDKKLAAYQFELKAAVGQIKIVGVEGGSHPAFQAPPYYDPAALMNNRIIIADFNTGQNLPQAKTLVATLHLQITADVEPEYELELAVAADGQGTRIPATISYQTGEIK